MRSFSRVAAGVLLVASSALLAPATVHGAGSRLGASFTAISTYTRGSSVAFDSKNGVYLVVSSNGPLNGRFVSADGAPIGSYFVIHGVGYTHFPQVAYSPDANGGAGGFLVSWHQTQAVGATPQVRMVSYSSGSPVYTPIVQLTTDGSWWEAGAQIAYSTTSKEFLVTWQAAGIRAHRISTTGEKLGSQIYITNTIDYFRDPSVAYSPVVNQFLVSFGGADAAGAFASAQRVAAGSGALVGGVIPLHRAASVYISEAAYNSATNRYLVAWWQPGGAFGKLVDTAGNVVSTALPLSTRFSAYDALGIDYNATTGTFMLVSHDQFSYQNGAVEISGAGVPDGIGFIATAMGATKGNFYPQIAANPNQPHWLLSTSTDFMSTTGQRLQSDASGGGGGGSSPGAANLVSPGGTSGAIPIYTWNSVAVASHYYLWVEDSNGAARVTQWYDAATVGCGSGSGTCAVNAGIELPAGGSKWWIQTWNSAGYGPWSAGMSFTVVTTPGQATLLSPDDIASRNPAYYWTAVPGTALYQLWVTDSTGARVQQWYAPATAGCASDTGTCAVNPGIGLSAGTAYWWVRTWNTQGYGPWSAGIQFTVSPLAPVTNLSASVIGKPTVRYRWTGVADSTHYNLWLNDGAGSTWINQWFTAAELGCSGGGTCTLDIAASGMANGLASFWIRGWSPATSFGPWTGPGQFTY